MGAYEMLHLIDEAYVIFDFVPWGMSRKDPKVKVPRSSRSFADDGRPDKFRKHWQWMCDVGRERFRWLQTDFVAIRRDLITDELVAKMGRLAEEVCGPGEGKANCMLRDARAGGVDGEREEL